MLIDTLSHSGRIGTDGNHFFYSGANAMAKKKALRVPVSERALTQRINRRLAEKEETLRKCSEKSKWWNDLGDYYIVDLRTNGMIARHVDIEALGRDLGCLKPWEDTRNA